jgi:hypothetical protein
MDDVEADFRQLCLSLLGSRDRRVLISSGQTRTSYNYLGKGEGDKMSGISLMKDSYMRKLCFAGSLMTPKPIFQVHSVQRSNITTMQTHSPGPLHPSWATR